MLDILKKIFLNDRDFVKFLSLICIFISFLLGIIFALKDDKSANFLYLIIAFLGISFLLMIFRSLKVKIGDKEIDLNTNQDPVESDNNNVK